MSNIKISVVIPSYRPQRYTFECLESLKRQTLSPEEYEVIVILNGDKAPYYSQLEEALPANGRLLYSPAASACSSRNMGLDEARGEYICFIDDDDLVSPSYLEELLKHARRDVIAASNCLSVYDDGHTGENPYTQEYKRCAEKGVQPFYQPKKIFSVPWMKLIHRDVIGDRRFDEHFPSGQDALLMFEISDRMEKVRFASSDAVYYWRQRGGSLHKLNYSRLISKYGRLAWAYTRLYFGSPLQYNLLFYLTRLLASVHAIIVRK
ncbi:MAG: glycosyltransferase family 2 protein [Bacteroidaceae bacterium]|nr:glycosyltransferase family 2 protein [Bacteroidaceae bacterium]